MKYKLDLHCHSLASDGALSIFELVALAKKVGLDALVLTDHEAAFQKNKTLLSSLRTINYDFGLPIIVGSEIATPYGEFLLFGDKVCSRWDCFRYDLHNKKFDVNQYWRVFNDILLHGLDYGLVICHPRFDVFWYEQMPLCFWDIVQGFEIQNGYEDFEKERPDVVHYLQTKLRRYKALRNSDCHIDELGMVSNEIEMDFVSEEQLIHWLRN